MTTYPTRFDNLRDLAKLPWFEVREGRLCVADPTVPEAIAARHMNLEVLAISCIANRAAGLGTTTLSEQEVLDTASRAQSGFGHLLEAIIARI